MGFKLRHHWAVSQAAWRASISPTLNGLMVGAFCLVIFGAIAFGLAIPPYIQAETATPSATQTLMKYVSFGVGTDGATQANGEEGTEGTEGAAGGGSTQTVLGQAPVLASLNSFVAQSPQVVQAKQQASSQGGAGQATPSQGNASNGGSQSSSSSQGSDGADANAPKPLDAATENAIHANLVSLYNQAGDYYNQMVAAYNALYKSMSSTDPHAFTNTGSIDAKQLDYNVQVFANKFEESRPPENSKWYATYEKMHPVISPIGNPAAILGNAVDITIPEAREWLARFTNSNGEITYMADFRKGYPGVRP